MFRIPLHGGCDGRKGHAAEIALISHVCVSRFVHAAESRGCISWKILRHVADESRAKERF